MFFYINNIAIFVLIMSLDIPDFIYSAHEVDISGNHIYDVSSFDNWTTTKSNNEIAQNHPILTPAILFKAKLFSQAQFKVKNTRTEKTIKNNHLLDLLEQPNAFQTGNDFMESLLFSMIANGLAVVRKKYIAGFEDEPEALYLLNPDYIKWPSGFKKKYSANKTIEEAYGNLKIKYREPDNEEDIMLKDLLFFYDLPNMMNKNPFKVKSRLDGLKQTLINTCDSLLAKNIILKSNGKELITGSGKSGDFVLTPDEKDDAEKLFNVNYGLGRNRKRGLITKANLNWKSLHIALRDLGLDESVKIDGNLIYTALHIPKDILSLEAKKTTYNNFKESMVSYIQNEMQSTLNSVVAVLQRELKAPNLKLCGDFEHLPIMQFVLIERYEGVTKRANALKALRLTGLPDDICLELCGFDSTIQLKDVKNGKEKSEEDYTETEEEITRSLEKEEVIVDRWLKSI